MPQPSGHGKRPVVCPLVLSPSHSATPSLTTSSTAGRASWSSAPSTPLTPPFSPASEPCPPAPLPSFYVVLCYSGPLGL